MPYPESCPECGGAFRNTGTHFTARRSEVGRHVLLELGCQNTTRRYWWNFTTGKLHEDGALVATGTLDRASTNGHAATATLERPVPAAPLPADVAPPSPPEMTTAAPAPTAEAPGMPLAPTLGPVAEVPTLALEQEEQETGPLLPPTPADPVSLKDAFVRQLQLDRLTLRQMRSLLLADEARRAIEVAAGATEATYERLALILFGTDLAQLLGKPSAAPSNPGVSAEERLELQREKARIRARLRRAAIKAAKQNPA